MSIDGFENEYEFVKLFNGKRIINLDPISRDLINSIFYYKSELSTISCWRNHFPQKADILIKVENHIKGISIKNSVHVEGITYFIDFLKKNNIPSHIIRNYLLFHYADGTTNGTGQRRISTEEYKKKNLQSIQQINEEFNKEEFIKKCVDRFILIGNNGIYPISAIIVGEPHDYYFILKEDIKNIIINKKDLISTGIHIGPLQVQPKNRCLNYNHLYEKDRFCVQINWYNLFDTISSIHMLQKIIKDSLNN